MPKRHSSRIEDLHQIAYFEWLKTYYPYIDALTIYIPNDGKRNQILGAKKGIKPGVPDIFMFYPSVVNGKQYHGLAIEMKRPIVKGKPKPVVSPEQKEMIRRLTEQDYYCEVCYSWDKAADVTKLYIGKWGSTT